MLQRSCIGGWRVFLSIADIICFVDNILAYLCVVLHRFTISCLISNSPMNRMHRCVLCYYQAIMKFAMVIVVSIVWWVRCASDTHWRVVILWIQIWNCPGLFLVKFSHLSHTALSHIVSVCMWWTCMGGILSNIYTNLKNSFSCADHDGNHDY